MQSADLVAALLLGLAGAGHCVGMCGGVAVALRPSDNASRWLPLSYHSGRLLSYGLLGALIGSAAGAIELASWTIALRFIAGLLLVGMGLQTLRWWLGMGYLEKIGGLLWRRIVPLTKPLLPPKYPIQGLLLGGLWGFMPCGLIYSALSWSAAAGASALDSGVLMLIFGLGTLPAMLTVTLAGQRVERLLAGKRLKQLIGLSLLLAGCWTVYLTAAHAHHLLNGAMAHQSTPAAEHSHH